MKPGWVKLVEKDGPGEAMTLNEATILTMAGIKKPFNVENGIGQAVIQQRQPCVEETNPFKRESFLIVSTASANSVASVAEATEATGPAPAASAATSGPRSELMKKAITPDADVMPPSYVE